LTKFRILLLFIILLTVIRLGGQDVAKTGDYGDRLKIGFVWEDDIFFHPLSIEKDYEAEINNLIYGYGLFNENYKGQIVHGIAVEDTILPSNVLRFKLRSDLFFQNGMQLKTEDVRYSYDLYKKYSKYYPFLYNTQFIELVEYYIPNIVRIRFEKPIENFQQTIGQLPILSKEYYKNSNELETISKISNGMPIGTGYYKLSEYIKGKQVNLNVYKEHFNGRGYLDGIDILFYDTYEQILDAFLHEQVDLLRISDKSVNQKVSQFTDNIISIDNDQRCLYYLNLNTNKFPFNQIYIRKALNYSINKNQIIKNLSNGIGHIAHSVLVNDDNTITEPFTIYKYLPLEGLQILQNNQFSTNNEGKLIRNGKELKFELLFEEGSPLEESIARIISINLGEIGINVIPRSLKRIALEKNFSNGDYQAILRHFDFNQENIYESLRKFYLFELNNINSFSNYRNTGLDLILEQISKTSDKNEILPLSYRFQHMLNRQSPVVFLFFRDRELYAIHPRFENVKTSILLTPEKQITKFNAKNEWYVPKDKQKY